MSAGSPIFQLADHARTPLPTTRSSVYCSGESKTLRLRGLSFKVRTAKYSIGTAEQAYIANFGMYDWCPKGK